MTFPFFYIKEAHKSLQSCWLISLLAYFLYYLSGYITSFLQIQNIFLLYCTNVFVLASLSIGIRAFNLSIAQNKEIVVSQIFDYIKYFFRSLSLILAVSVFSLVGFFFLIIPGVIVLINYSQVYYIMAQNPNKGVITIMNESLEMMKGHRVEYFKLCLLFVPGFLLGLVTYGFAMLFVGPYFGVSTAKFYLAKSDLFEIAKGNENAKN